MGGGSPWNDGADDSLGCGGGLGGVHLKTGVRKIKETYGALNGRDH